MKTQLTASALLVAAMTLGACNTIEGAGRDVQAAGSAVEGAASDTREEISDDE